MKIILIEGMKSVLLKLAVSEP